jgi:hypothetical protein
MVIADFLHLSDTEYAARIKSYPDSQLHKQLKVKHMQVKVGSSIKDTGAIFGYIGSFLGFFLGEDIIVPLVLDAIPSLGKRRVDVSEQKIRLLGEELTRRDHAKTKLSKVYKLKIRLLGEGPRRCDHAKAKLSEVSKQKTQLRGEGPRRRGHSKAKLSEVSEQNIRLWGERPTRRDHAKAELSEVSEQKIQLLEEELAQRDHANAKLREAVERPPAYERVVVEQTRGRVVPSAKISSPGISRQGQLLIFASVLLVAFTVACILRAKSYLLPAALRPMLMRRIGSVH